MLNVTIPFENWNTDNLYPLQNRLVLYNPYENDNVIYSSISISLSLLRNGPASHMSTPPIGYFLTFTGE